MSVIVDPEGVGTPEMRTLCVEGADRKQLLVRFLGEMLFLYDGAGFVGKEFHVTSMTPTALTVEVKGEKLDVSRHQTRLDVKAITYHQLEIIENPEGATVRVFLDI